MQDRLVKELRLRGISTIEEANAYAAEFMADYNRRFGKAPLNDFDAHRALLASDSLEDAFQWKEPRKVSKNLTLNFRRKLYLLEESPASRALIGKHALVYETDDGSVRVRVDQGFLPARAFAKDQAHVTQSAVVSNKMLGAVLNQIKERQDVVDPERTKALRTKRERRLVRSGSPPTDGSPRRGVADESGLLSANYRRRRKQEFPT